MTRISDIAAAVRRRMNSPVAIGVTLAVVAVLTMGAALGINFKLPGISSTRPMCAEFRDAVGLYPGNKVMLLGIEVGSVTAVTNKPDFVRVDFTVAKDLDLPADIGAVTYSESIVTDRHVELTKPYSGGAKFTENRCLTLDSTKTPIGVSETFSAVGKLADMILASEPGQPPEKAPGVQAINGSLKAASHSLAGTGPETAQMLRDLVTMLGDPYKADADYRELYENAQIFTSGWLNHWDTFAELVRTLPATTDLIQGMADNFASAIENMNDTVPILLEMVNRFGPRVYHNISDKLIPWTRDILNAYTPHIVSFINTLPQVVNWLSDIYEPAWGTHNITYIPPHVAISPTQAGAICANLRERGVPGSEVACAAGTASDPVTLGLTDLLMGAALAP